MSHYSTRSRTRLQTADVQLQLVFSEVDPRYPNTILEGRRTIEQQEKNVANRVSKTMDSLHLEDPSEAIDAAPDPLSWPKLQQVLDEISDAIEAGHRTGVRKLLTAYAKDLARWYHFGGYVQGTADQMRRHGEIQQKIRWGGDWDGDRDFTDQRFDDLAHFELR